MPFFSFLLVTYFCIPQRTLGCNVIQLIASICTTCLFHSLENSSIPRKRQSFLLFKQILPNYDARLLFRDDNLAIIDCKQHLPFTLKERSRRTQRLVAEIGTDSPLCRNKTMCNCTSTHWSSSWPSPVLLWQPVLWWWWSLGAYGDRWLAHGFFPRIIIRLIIAIMVTLITLQVNEFL